MSSGGFVEIAVLESTLGSKYSELSPLACDSLTSSTCLENSPLVVETSQSLLTDVAIVSTTSRVLKKAVDCLRTSPAVQQFGLQLHSENPNSDSRHSASGPIAVAVRLSSK